MRYPRATRRLSGIKMMTTTIEVHIDFDALMNVFVYELSFVIGDKYKYIADMTKHSLWKMTVNIIETSGSNWFPEGYDIDSIREMYGDRMCERIYQLFPELKG